jgi:metal-responsive CopG/Arc/MetJ family transcriptional regulator
MQTMVQLSDALLEVLDRRAVETGRSRSDLIREAIEQYYKEDIEAAIDRAMVDGYTRVPDDEELDGLAEADARALIGEEPW